MGSVRLFDEPAASPQVSLRLCWDLMEHRHRKALLIIAGMDARLTETGDYAKQPNANFYCRLDWIRIPTEWREKVARFLVGLNRGGDQYVS